MAARDFFLIDKYKLLNFIGAGGMGKVFLCEHLILQRLVAVKLLQVPGDADSRDTNSAIERFHREARAVAALDHPGIVRVFDVDRINGNPFMVIEYVDGTNFHQIVTRFSRMSLARSANAIKQAALGLQHAHLAGLVHRDIKPSNILLDRFGTVKLVDLGLARFSQDLAKNEGITTRFDHNVVVGTVDFMAPEQSVNSSQVDIRSDIYSLGCTFYFLLSGRVPYPEGSIPQKMYMHHNMAPEPLSELLPQLPPGIVRIIDRMIAKDPKERYQTPGEIAEELAEWTKDPLPAPPEEEMPHPPASHYRLGLAHRVPLSSAQVTTPRAGLERRYTERFECRRLEPERGPPIWIAFRFAT